MAIAQPKLRQCDERESPSLPEPSEQSSISTPPMKIGTVERRVTSSDMGTFNSEDEPGKIVLLSSPPIYAATLKKESTA